jgi:hypothetical protein
MVSMAKPAHGRQHGGGGELGERGRQGAGEWGLRLLRPAGEIRGGRGVVLPESGAGQHEHGGCRSEPPRVGGAAAGRWQQGGKTRGGNDGGAVGLFAGERGGDSFARQGVGLAQGLPFARPVGVGGEGVRELGAQRGIGGIFQGPPGQIAKALGVVIHTRDVAKRRAIVSWRGWADLVPEFLEGAEQVTAHGGGLELHTRADLLGRPPIDEMFLEDALPQRINVGEQGGDIKRGKRDGGGRRFVFELVERECFAGTALGGVAGAQEGDGAAAGDDRSEGFKGGPGGWQGGAGREVREGAGGGILGLAALPEI